MVAKKLIFVVVDGLGDRRCRSLFGKTPLEAASTPFLDFFAKNGKVGLVNVVDPSIPPTSETGILSLLGYDVLRIKVSRGPLEALGVGIQLTDELAFRTDFATFRNGIIVDRRAGRIREGTKELEEAINEKVLLEGVNFIFKSTIGHRGVVIFYSDKFELSEYVSDTDPGKPGVPPKLCKPLILGENELRTAKIVNEFVRKSHLVLNFHKVNLQRRARGLPEANYLLLRGAGVGLPKLRKLPELYKRFWTCIAGSPLEKGICRLVGMNVVDIPEATGDIDTNLRRKVKALFDFFDEYDCFFVHIKGPDEPGHDGNCHLKKEIIEKIDGEFFSEIFSNINLKNTILCVTADHATPCELRKHSSDPVPILICGGKVKKDEIDIFSERSCMKGSLGTLMGTEVLKLLMGELEK